jgi:hypothetical protein
MKTVGMGEILREKIELCRELETLLDEILEHKRGSIWAEEQVPLLNSYFIKLEKIDRFINLGGSASDTRQKESIPALIRELESRMLSLKRSLALFETRLAGGRQAISLELKELPVGKDLRSYHNRTVAALNSAEIMG